jgi:hypothetical protein
MKMYWDLTIVLWNWCLHEVFGSYRIVLTAFCIIRAMLENHIRKSFVATSMSMAWYNVFNTFWRIP